MGEVGKIMLWVLISERGQPEKVNIEQSSGRARLDETARQTAVRLHVIFKFVNTVRNEYISSRNHHAR